MWLPEGAKSLTEGGMWLTEGAKSLAEGGMWQPERGVRSPEGGMWMLEGERGSKSPTCPKPLRRRPNTCGTARRSCTTYR